MSCTTLCAVYCTLHNFYIRKQVHLPPYGQWEYVPFHVWATNATNTAAMQDDGGNEVGVCVWCSQKVHHHTLW